MTNASTGSTTPTSVAVSADSGEHWSAEGAWPAADGVHRIPLPLPMDGLRAVNVYAVEADDGLTLVDGGWAIPVARDQLERSLRRIGAGFGDVRRFLVTHAHRDHYTLARVLGSELGVDVAMGRAEQPSIDLVVDRLTRDRAGKGSETAGAQDNPFVPLLVSAGAPELAQQWAAAGASSETRSDWAAWRPADTWLEGDVTIAVGTRALDALHTPGHTPGHYVFADRAAGLLFAGDHVLPTITPSIGFAAPPPPQPLGDFMASLTKVRALPDLRLLPAHGPVADSTHARVDQLLAHHEERLARCLAVLGTGVDGDGAVRRTAEEVADALPWTRHQHAYATLDVFNRALATMETKAHLELLVARGAVTRTTDAASSADLYTPTAPPSTSPTTRLD